MSDYVPTLISATEERLWYLPIPARLLSSEDLGCEVFVDKGANPTIRFSGTLLRYQTADRAAAYLSVGMTDFYVDLDHPVNKLFDPPLPGGHIIR